MEADFCSRENHYRTDLNRFRWVHDRMNECWFALLVRCRVDTGTRQPAHDDSGHHTLCGTSMVM